MGAESVDIVYRRSDVECPARAEEVHHAMQEGVRFSWLTNPVEIHGNEGGWAVARNLQFALAGVHHGQRAAGACGSQRIVGLSCRFAGFCIRRLRV